MNIATASAQVNRGELTPDQLLAAVAAGEIEVPSRPAPSGETDEQAVEADGRLGVPPFYGLLLSGKLTREQYDQVRATIAGL